MKCRAIYPGTFDPFTYGHEDIARRAARMFSEVIVAVAESSSKDPFFPLQDRLAMVRELLEQEPTIRVVGFSGLLVDLVREYQAGVVVRGLRAVTDFEYEFQLAGMNRKLDANFEAVFLMPADQYMFISASMVREVASLGGDVSKFVSPLVHQKMLKQRQTQNQD